MKIEPGSLWRPRRGLVAIDTKEEITGVWLIIREHPENRQMLEAVAMFKDQHSHVCIPRYVFGNDLILHESSKE